MFIKETDKETILKPLQIVIGIVERKQTLPILSNILIEKEQNEIRFTATDLEIQISTSIPLSSGTTQSSAITVGGKKILDILKILPDHSHVTIDTKDNKAIVKSKNSRFTLQSLPAQDFPMLNSQLDGANTFTISQSKLKLLLNSVQYSMAQQDVRYYLNGVLLIVESNLLKVVATDGHRLAYNAGQIEGVHDRQELILPRKAVLELCKLLVDTEDLVKIEFTPQQLKASFSGVTLISKVIEGKFPDYERVIPKYTNHLEINRQTVQQALQRAAILSNEKFRGVRFVLTEKNLSIISNNSEQEEAQEEIQTSYQGEALDIGFNVNYLMDGLNNLSSETATFSFGDPNSSILISTETNADFKYVVMPMRI
ncbi:MAG: DNA polymerase III subunit beta [Gallionella sp.]